MATTKPDRSGAKNPFYGRRHSPETIAKMVDSHRGRTLTPEHKRKLSENKKAYYARLRLQQESSQ